ncbi:hypothetical protein ACWEV3_02520 [Saccharopolyspora sp. NPDC003752]
MELRETEIFRAPARNRTSPPLIPALASGEAVSFARPDIAFASIRGAALARWALVWRTASRTPDLGLRAVSAGNIVIGADGKEELEPVR